VWQDLLGSLSDDASIADAQHAQVMPTAFGNVTVPALCPTTFITTCSFTDAGG
jgi:hypothetical protein